MRKAYRHATWVKVLFLVGLAVLVVVASAVIVTIGQVPMTIGQVYGTVVDKIFPGLFPMDPLVTHVVWKIRLPLIVGAILAGAGLGLCGCVMQTVLKNPMASPFTLGISSGAHFGVSIAAVFGVSVMGGPYLMVGNAFVFALLCSGCIIALSMLRGATSETLVLAGIAVNYLFQALNELMSYIATDEQKTLMSYWGMGSLNDLNWRSVLFMGVVSLVCIGLLYAKSWDLNLMTVGDESASSMGVNPQRTRIFVMVVASLLVSTIVAFIGVIGFIGLIAPHIGRLVIGNDHRYLVPASCGIGAALLLIANAVAMNALGTSVIPTGIVMSILGVPLFLYLILKGKRRDYWA
jgi:iron complex transport system permease protein